MYRSARLANAFSSPGPCTNKKNVKSIRRSGVCERACVCVCVCVCLCVCVYIYIYLGLLRDSVSVHFFGDMQGLRMTKAHFV